MRLMCAVALVTGSAYSCQTGVFASQPTGPGNNMLDGSWFAGTVSVASANQAVTCTASNLTFTLAQNGTTVTGTYAWSDLTCRGPGTPPSYGAMSGAIANGTVIANSFAFDLGNTGFHFSGTIGNSAIYGPCSLDIAFAPPTGQAMLNGGWTATPQ